jgi:hypothetical protein
MSKVNVLGILLYSSLLVAGLHHLGKLLIVMAGSVVPQSTQLVFHPKVLMIWALVSISGLMLLVFSFRFILRPTPAEITSVKLITVGLILIYIPFGLLLSIAFIAATSKRFSKFYIK